MKSGTKKTKKIKMVVLIILFLNILFFFNIFPVEGKFYVVTDKEGNIIRFTSQNKISSQDKASGYIIIEKYGSEKKDSYGFHDIDWKQLALKAQEIETAINDKKQSKLSYPEFSVIATAYTPHERCCYPYADGFTSTNYKAGYRSVAIDPEYGMFSYGDILYIEGYGIGLANDCGSAIKGKRIDVCFDLGEEKKAIEWGRKKVRVWIVREWNK